MTGGGAPLDASVGVSQRNAGTAVDGLLAAGGNARRVANGPGGGAAVTADDVAAGAGRGVVGAHAGPGSVLEPHLRTPDHHAFGGGPLESSPGTPVEVRPVAMPLLDRLASGVVTAVPPVMLGIGMWFGWAGNLLDWRDLLVLAVSYVVIGTGVTVGFHRLLTHRSFKTSRLLRAAFAALGSAAAEGPVIDWVATHRKHHQFSDVPGDPHSPHLAPGTGWRGAVRGLLHAHIGWVFTDMEVADERRYAKDLLADPMIRFVDRTFVLWVIAGLAFPFGLGVALSGSVAGGLTALLWGGAARIFLLHHATFSINSLCHFFGRRDYETSDQSRNLAWLAIPTWGEAWHNNHHAFPTSYRHGLRRWQLDPSAAIIRLLELLGLARDVVRIDDARLRRAKAARPVSGACG